MSRIIPIVQMTKKAAAVINGGLSQTSKMPCKSYSLPTVACQTGFKMAAIPGTVCSECYANKGFYSMYAASIEPGQHARLTEVLHAMEDTEAADLWVSAMVASIGTDAYFRWHDSGDLQGVAHLELIAAVALASPHCRHWLPTREVGMVKEYVAKHGALPENLMVRLSATHFDVAVKTPASLQGVANVATSNVHKKGPALGTACAAPSQDGECRDCRACWHDAGAISYAAH